MLEFMKKLEEMVNEWPDQTKISLVQISDRTNCPVPVVLETISSVLPKITDVHEPIARKDVDLALNSLRQRLMPEIEAQRQRDHRRRTRTRKAFEDLMLKINEYQSMREWRKAYKSISYFTGLRKPDMDNEILLTACNECLRLGIKAGANMQELSQWLRTGVQTALKTPSLIGLDDAIDFIDAYSDYFLEQDEVRGRKLLESVTQTLKLPALEFGATPRLTEILAQLNLTHSFISTTYM